ncbi:MAG: hypothetical protein OQL09_10260 [Gammaproteobacteria bacterium]|nr:hypothetical protein [Gammaproteobacteria bacterium]
MTTLRVLETGITQSAAWMNKALTIVARLKKIVVGHQPPESKIMPLPCPNR